MKKRVLVPCLLLIVFTCAAAIGCGGDETSTEKPAESETVTEESEENVSRSNLLSEEDAQLDWREVTVLSGEGSKKTEEFRLTKDRYRVDQVMESEETVSCIVTMWGPSNYNRRICEGTNTGTEITKGAACSATPGSYYLDVNFPGKWELTVYEADSRTK